MVQIAGLLDNNPGGQHAIKQKAYIHILEANLDDVASPFIQRLSFKFLKLTSTEIQVANLIKQEKKPKILREL